MPLEKDDDFNKEDIICRLKAKGRDGNQMITYVEFLFSLLRTTGKREEKMWKRETQRFTFRS